MATTNHDRVGKALDLLRAGLGPFVEREVKSAVAAKRLDLQSLRGFNEDPLGDRPVSELDVAGLLRLMWEAWNAVFREILGSAERGLVGEMRGHRNRWAHQESFSSDDAYRAPTADAAQRGLEDRRIKLGCVLPGESPAVFGDALRRLAGAATYLYQDGPRYWYSTQPTVTQLAEDRAERLRREPDKVEQELAKRLRDNVRQSGDFSRVHTLPQSGQEVPDDLDARLVVLGSDQPYSREVASPAELAAKAILDLRGNTPRLYRNSLVLLAADKVRLQDLDEALRKYLAWESILTEKEELNLDPHQTRQGFEKE